MPEPVEPWADPDADPRRLLDHAVAAGVFPGVVALVADLHNGDALFVHAAGRTATDWPGAPVHAGTLFDLASLTKVYSATLCLRLHARGALDLDFAPKEHGRAQATVRDLIEHRAGLPAWAAFYKHGDPVDCACTVEPDPAAVGRALYSDVGFLQLRRRIERCTGQPFDDVLRSEVLDPLGLGETGYRSVGNGQSAALALSTTGDVAATERCPDRGPLCGEVHDENTWHLGGVAAHAGLFATAMDVARFARAVVDAPATGFLPAALAEAIWDAPRPGGSHVLGWDSPSGPRSSAGTRLGTHLRGHLGFTGTSLWIDRDRAVAIVLLTNRVHPSRTDERIRRFRPAFHDAVVPWLALCHPSRPSRSAPR